MSESAVTEVNHPVQAQPETAATDMPFLEGAPDMELPTAPTQKPEVFIPNRDQLAMSDRGMPKHGIPDNPEIQAEVKSSDLSSKAGSIFHGVARVAIAELGKIRDEGNIAVNGLRRAILDDHRERLHRRSPALFRGWSKKAADMMPELLETLLPGPGYSAFVVPEARLRVDDDAKAAAATLKEVLEEDQQSGDSAGLFEKILRSAPSFQKQSRRDGRFTMLLHGLSSEFPLSRNAIRKLTYQARTHMFIKGGDIIAPPTSQPDILEFIFKDGDTEAQQASEALSNVFREHIGFDPDRLHYAEVSFTHKDKTTGEEQAVPVKALDAVHWAVGLIASGRITPCVLDIKLQPHVGKKWDALNPLWKEYGHSLPKIFSKGNLDPKTLEFEYDKYEALQEHWNDMERNVAATTYSVLAFLRMAEREYRIRNRDSQEHEPLARWETLAKRVRAAILLVDFDISKHGEPLEHTLDELPLGYQTTPPIEQAGIPKDVSIMLRPIDDDRLKMRLLGREREMRRQYLKHKLGQMATQAMLGKAA